MSATLTSFLDRFSAQRRLCRPDKQRVVRCIFHWRNAVQRQGFASVGDSAIHGVYFVLPFSALESGICWDRVATNKSSQNRSSGIPSGVNSSSILNRTKE